MTQPLHQITPHLYQTKVLNPSATSLANHYHTKLTTPTSYHLIIQHSPTMPLNALDHHPLSLFHPLTAETVVSGMSKELDMTYWLVVTLVTLPTISLAIHTPPQDVTITKLPQGISTYSGDAIYCLKADWTVLVLLQKPTPDPRMFSIFKSLRKIISHSNFTIDEGIKRN